MSVFIKSGHRVTINSENSVSATSHLPPAIYTLRINPHNGEFYLETIAEFKIPEKLYFDTTSMASRIFHTFESRPESTGVLLNGNKGSGKTLLAKVICQNALKHDIPTIVVAESFSGEKFKKFIQDIDHSCIVFFDEFEKIFDREEQEELLTLFDGVFNSKKLFILTCNSIFKIDSCMINRPGRMYYSLDFNSIRPEFIKEYCEDNLNNKAWCSEILNIASLIHGFNFDMLKALVEESNRYEESPTTGLKFLNIKIEDAVRTKYVIKLWHKGKVVPTKLLFKNSILYHYDPTDEDNGGPTLGFYTNKAKNNYIEVELLPSNVTSITAEKVEFNFPEDKVKVVLTRKEVKQATQLAFGYSSFIGS